MTTMYGLARLGRDAEIKTTKNGDSMCNLSLAFSYGRKGDDGKRPTQWVDGVLFGRRAEALAEYLIKGGLVMVSLTDVHIEEWDDRDGLKRSKLTGFIGDIQLAGGGQGDTGQRQPTRAPAPAPRAAAPAPRQSGGGYQEADCDSDIPF
jgi:single-strand DNA-binding protein